MITNKYANYRVEKISFENAMRSIIEQGKGNEYLSAYRFHDKKFVDSDGNVQSVTFTHEERLQCLIQNIEHVTVMLNVDVQNETEVYEEYNAQLKEYKDALFSLMNELKRR